MKLRRTIGLMTSLGLLGTLLTACNFGLTDPVQVSPTTSSSQTEHAESDNENLNDDTEDSADNDATEDPFADDPDFQDDDDSATPPERHTSLPAEPE